MARYLVTGGAGFLGSHLGEDLVAKGHAVRVLDDLSNASRRNVLPQAEFIEGDVTDRRIVRRAFEDIDGCFHLAAIASVERCHREWLRNHQVNLTGTINVFDAARRLRSRPAIPVVYASTAAVYGDGGSLPVSESHPVAPLSAYGADKAACEFHARVAGGVYDVPTAGLRLFNLYGPRQDPTSPYSGVITIFIERLRRGLPIEIFGDGEQVRDFTYVGDAVAALQRAMCAASTEAQVFNVCTGIRTSVRALAESIADVCGTRLVAHYSSPRRGEVRVSVGDPSLAAEALEFRARTRLADGLAETLEAIVNSESGAFGFTAASPSAQAWIKGFIANGRGI
jgi:UDP-glucose 4-epimerase